MQPLGAAGKAACRQQQKRKGRQQRRHRADRAHTNAHASKNDVHNLLHPFVSIRFFSRLRSITCRTAITEWYSSILGPENRITARIFSRMSGL